MVLGGGPNHIGQGIEFDYCCVRTAMAMRDGYRTIMVNCNPETVSTDYGHQRPPQYFEPLTLEDVLEIVDKQGRKPFGDRPVRRTDAIWRWI
jgi:carbamoyl-phosphate synthase large subunit